MTILNVLFGILAVLTWAAVIADLAVVRQFRSQRRVRRTTRRIWRNHPDARPRRTNERAHTSSSIDAAREDQ